MLWHAGIARLLNVHVNVHVKQDETEKNRVKYSSLKTAVAPDRNIILAYHHVMGKQNLEEHDNIHP